MARMKRKDVLTAIRVAGYHGDKERGILLYVKNWISLETYVREFDAGAAMRENGVPCDCLDCTKGDTDGVGGSRYRLPCRPQTLKQPGLRSRLTVTGRIQSE